MSFKIVVKHNAQMLNCWAGKIFKTKMAYSLSVNRKK